MDGRMDGQQVQEPQVVTVPSLAKFCTLDLVDYLVDPRHA